MSQKTVEFSYWSDPLCIWAFVAQRRLEQVLESHAGRLVVRYHTVPVFGSVPWRFAAGPWAVLGVEGRVEATRRIAQEHGIEGVSGEAWRSAQPASSWSPGAAVRACFAAEQEGEAPAGAGAAYELRMRQRFFLDDVNVALRGAQLALAEEVGVPPSSLERRLDDGSALAALWEDYQEKERLRVQGSPTYVFDGGRAQLYGDFPYSILEATVEALLGGRAPGASAC